MAEFRRLRLCRPPRNSRRLRRPNWQQIGLYPASLSLLMAKRMTITMAMMATATAPRVTMMEMMDEIRRAILTVVTHRLNL